MKIICNGEGKQVPQGLRIGQLIAELKLDPQSVVAECDGRILQPEEYDSCMLQEGSVVELVRFVGGG